jgi:hypothetical protein
MSRVDEQTYVELPANCSEPYEVYVNGVLQERGVDYAVEGGRLRFDRRLAQEGKLGALRWTSMFLGIAGTYKKNDSVDVVFTVDGKRVVASRLPITSAGVRPAEP